MGYIRPAQAKPSPSLADSECLEAFDKELDYVFDVLRRAGAPPREIEDLAQEVFLVLRRHWSTLDTTRPLRGYLFGVAFRIVRAHRRRLQRETPDAAIEAEDVGPDPEGTLESKESVSVLMSALERVPTARRDVLIMHHLEGLPIVDIAQKLSITRFGAYARLRKAHKELAAAVRKLLKIEGNRHEVR